MPNTTITAVPASAPPPPLRHQIHRQARPRLLVSDVPAAAAVFTTNKVVGAPVIVGRRHIRHGNLRACITNSGCANVCTGRRGIDDALEMCALTAAAWRKIPAVKWPSPKSSPSPPASSATSSPCTKSAPASPRSSPDSPTPRKPARPSPGHPHHRPGGQIRLRTLRLGRHKVTIAATAKAPA